MLSCCDTNFLNCLIFYDFTFNNTNDFIFNNTQNFRYWKCSVQDYNLLI